jgi:peptide deformylase
METVLDKTEAIGVAANQLGKSIQAFAIKLKSEGIFTLYINPEILNASEEVETRLEGCLSFPNYFTEVTRPLKIRVSYQNLQLERMECELTGIHARVFLHEYDHIQGKTFIDNLTKVQKLTDEKLLEISANIRKSRLYRI